MHRCQYSQILIKCKILVLQREREAYEVKLENGKLVYKQSGLVVDTDAAAGTKWIFVLSTMRNMYVGEKKKGLFQHSSFVAGGAIIAAGRFVASNGVLEVCLFKAKIPKYLKKQFNVFSITRKRISFVF